MILANRKGLPGFSSSFFPVDPVVMIFTPKTLDETQGIGVPINWASRLIKTHRHWWRTEGAGVKIAILDSGINLKHPAFKGAIKGYKNFTGGDEDDVEDETGHGTHCAGIIAAREIAPDGMCGIAPQSELYVAKVISGGKGNWESATEAIKWVLHLNKDIRKENVHKIKEWKELHVDSLEKAKPIKLESEISIINMSFSGNLPTPEFYKVIHKALASGICIITAAGNEGARLGNGIGFPGKYGSVITVGSHDEFGTPSNFSSRGGEIDFLAPGYDVWSTDISRPSSPNNYHNWYKKRSGTSMAAPFVSGLAALIKSKHLSNANSQTPVENCQDLYKHLIRMSAHPGYFDQESGYGPLLSFGNWDKIVNSATDILEDGFAEKYIFYTEKESIVERDDRTDINRLRDLDYWRLFKRSYSGRYWNHLPSEALREILVNQGKLVGFMVKQSCFGKPLTDLAGEQKLKFKTRTYSHKVKVKEGAPLCESERFGEQPVLEGRTVFFSGKKNIFFTASHKLNPIKEKENRQWLPGVGDEYLNYDVEDYVILFGYTNDAFAGGGENEDSIEVCIDIKNVFKCKRAIGSVESGDQVNDWLVIHGTPVAEEAIGLHKISSYVNEKVLGLANDFGPFNGTETPQVLYSFGSPIGLPTKFIPDGSNELLGAPFNSLDMFGGNSGSPIYRADSFSLVGVHTSGVVERDRSPLYKKVKKGDKECCQLNSTSKLSSSTFFSKYQAIESFNNGLEGLKFLIDKSNNQQ